ncbi:MAG TPA: DUF3857 domain-containing protein [Thermoanaerobaculia bacterium]|nr:DUF3857 domain-containing protein [Thermoanaerobaculia bacterium]
MRSTSILFLALFAALPVPARELDVRPAPAWVERAEADTSVAIARENVRWGIYDILSDHQVRVTDTSESQYFRTVRRVLSPSGVQNASELSLDFDPDFQRLTIHDVSIVRGNRRIDALDADEIRVIDKEDDADQRIYDGQRTALLFLRDVRPGDVIDYAWSLDGRNPVLDGRYTDEYDLSSGVPTRRARHRLVWPAGRPLQWRGVDPLIAMNGREQVFVWERRDIRALDVEDSIPSWYEPWETVQVTEFASWSEVAVWANAMFQLDERSSDEVKKLAARIYGVSASHEARVTAAIRFVQDDIRYLGIEMGRNSHEPHQPWETLYSRWGDCKDKTLLLVALLRELGVEAYPALVNTRIEHRLADKLPSPFLFDHVIAQVIDRGRTYWVDGTISDQGGTLASIETPNDGRALIVRAETHALTPIVTNTNGSMLVEQTFTTTDYAKPTLLSVKTTFTGGRADAMRSELASLSLEDFASGRINDLAMDSPKIEAGGAPKIHDDRSRNMIVVTEKYVLRDLWKDGHWTWYPRVLESHLRRPDTMIRAMPLDFDYPLDVRQTVTFNFPEVIAVEESTSVTETPTFRYEYVVDRNGRTVWIKQSLRARRGFVEAKDVPDHLTKISAIWSEIGYRLALPRRDSPTPAPLKWGVGLFIVAAFVAFCWMLATRRRVVPALVFRPGEAPASALAVNGTDEIHQHLAGLACACGAALYSAPELQRARYAEREMTIITRQCGACGREQSVYFTAA